MVGPARPGANPDAGGGEAIDDGAWLTDMIDTIDREAGADHRLCSFRHKTSAEVVTLTAGPDRYALICDE
jgi:hypothetical protein